MDTFSTRSEIETLKLKDSKQEITKLRSEIEHLKLLVNQDEIQESNQYKSLQKLNGRYTIFQAIQISLLVQSNLKLNK